MCAEDLEGLTVGAAFVEEDATAYVKREGLWVELAKDDPLAETLISQARRLSPSVSSRES